MRAGGRDVEAGSNGATDTPRRSKDVVSVRMTNTTCVVIVFLVGLLLSFFSGYYVREHQTAEAAARVSALEDLLVGGILNEEHKLLETVQSNELVHELEARLAEGIPGADTCTDGLFVRGPVPTLGNTLKYLLLLAWSFLGVAVFADLFMVAIEEITSQEVVAKVQVGQGRSRTITSRIWNPTVANLTLMALGSSAPEILLSVIEIFGNNFYSGELGPSTIVGSAAFNLMVISAVCVVAIPEGDGRLIQELPVFYITATFSVFAYAWLIVILSLNTPNVVDVWEGMITFLFFPLLVGLAYQADIQALPNLCALCDKAPELPAGGGGKAAKGKRQSYISESDFDKKSGSEKAVGKSKAHYRINATRQMTGSRSIEEANADAFSDESLLGASGVVVAPRAS